MCRSITLCRLSYSERRVKVTSCLGTFSIYGKQEKYFAKLELYYLRALIISKGTFYHKELSKFAK